MIKDFDLEAQERLGHVESLLLAADQTDRSELPDVKDSIKKDLHTLKGNSAMMGLSELQQIAHGLEEDVLASPEDSLDVAGLLKGVDEFRRALAVLTGRSPDVDKPSAGGIADAEIPTDSSQGSVRVSFDALDELMQQVADMVTLRNRVLSTLDRGRRLDTEAEDYSNQSKKAWNDLTLAHEALARTLDFIQDRVVRLRMVPLGSLFRSLNRIVHDEANAAGKKVKLETVGGDTPLDKALLELASDALGHLVRNSVVHGIESPEERTKAGKPAGGTVRVIAKARGNEVRIEVVDDGGGIDVKALAQTAKRRRIDDIDPNNPYSILFLAGFSTKTEADLSSGRGVGLSAVLESVQRQGGQIDVKSELGAGTMFSLDLPLSVSITRALMLEVDGQEYALPLMHVVESTRIEPGDSHMLNKAGVLEWRGKVIPLLDLGHAFKTSDTLRGRGFVVVVQAGGNFRGLVGDTIKGIQEVVVNTLGPIVGQPTGIAGSTILGDGRPVLILDARSLVDVEPFVGEPA